MGGNMKKTINKVKSWSTKLYSFLQKLMQNNFKILSTKEYDYGTVLKIKPNDPKFSKCELWIYYKDDKRDICDVKLVYKGKSKELKDIKPEKLESEVFDKLDDMLNELVTATTKVYVALSKVTASTESSVILTAINANCAVSTANMLIDNVVSNDEFVAQLTESPSSYLITETDDSINVESVDSFDTTEMLEILLSAALQLWSITTMIECGTHGLDLPAILPTVLDCNYRAMSNVKFFENLIVNRLEHPINPLYSNSEFTNYDLDDTSVECALETLLKSISDYIELLDMCYPNFTHDEQYQLDGLISEWKCSKQSIKSLM